MNKRSGSASVKRKGDSVVYENLDYVQLVDIVRKSRSKQRSDFAFNEIEKRIAPKIKQISYRFNIPGSERSDVYQEALIALRTKAIKDYDQNRGNGSGPYPFEKFAVLCIRRHLSTKLKACYQNRKRVWISTVSLHEPADSNDDSLFLADIIPHTEGNLLEAISKDEHSKNLFRKLFQKLSEFEKEVFLLHLQKNSYEKIKEKINTRIGKTQKVNVKSIDNALSRIKNKAHVVRDRLDLSNEQSEKLKKQKDVKSVDNALGRIKNKAHKVRDMDEMNDG